MPDGANETHETSESARYARLKQEEAPAKEEQRAHAHDPGGRAKSKVGPDQQSATRRERETPGALSLSDRYLYIYIAHEFRLVPMAAGLAYMSEDRARLASQCITRRSRPLGDPCCVPRKRLVLA